jgi:hypothetical protein
MSFLHALRCWERRVAGLRHLADLDGILDPGEPVQPVQDPAQRRCVLRADRAPPRQVVCGAREQDAPRTREGHDARGDGLREPLDLERLRAAGDVVREILAKHDLPHVNANA